MEFYYKKEISVFSPKCPPDDYKIISRLSCRWVFDPIENENNFKAQAEKNPRILNKKGVDMCEAYALSFHNTLNDSHNHFEYLVKFVCRSDRALAFSRFGANVAIGLLNYTDGVSGDIEPNGHFNFHHVKGNNFVSNFKIKESL